ncbi:MAG: porin [Saprospiraceae bacterium]
MKSLLVLLFLFGFNALMFAQTIFDNWLKNQENFKIEPFLSLQLWSTYTLGQEVYNINNKQYELVDNRLNILLRRARLGFRVEPLRQVQFTLALGYDGIGRDVHSGLVGVTNNGNQPSIGVVDAFLHWKILKDSEGFNLVGGYFRPQLSRESMTGAWAVTSMDKAAAQNYLRAHLVGVNLGRVPGINIGGLLINKHLHYNFGIFNPLFQSNNGNSTGIQYAPLLVGRVALTLGEPEMDHYKIVYDINYYNERKGITLALGAAWQGETDLFRNNAVASLDLLLNYNALNIEGEWNWLWRGGKRSLLDQTIDPFVYQSETGYLRASYNIIINNKIFLEPSFMLSRFYGGMNALEQDHAKAVSAFAGQDFSYDMGINWHLQRRNLKIMLHYTWREGQAGAAGAGATVNQFFNQPNVGAIRRGDWIGVGLNAIFQ